MVAEVELFSGLGGARNCGWVLDVNLKSPDRPDPTLPSLPLLLVEIQLSQVLLLRYPRGLRPRAHFSS